MLSLISLLAISNFNLFKYSSWNYSIQTEIKDAPIITDDGLNMYLTSSNTTIDVYHFKNHDGNSTQLKCSFWHDIKQINTQNLFIPPILDNENNILYLLSSDNYLIAYDLSLPGDFFNGYCYPPSMISKNKLAFIQGRVNSPGILNTRGNTIYFGTIYPDNTLYAVDIHGDLLWKFHTYDSILSSPILSDDENTIFIGSQDSKMYSIDTVNGIPNWIFKTNNFIRTSPVLNNNTLLVTSQDNNIYILDNQTGIIIQNLSVGNIRKPIYYGNNLILTTTDGIITYYKKYSYNPVFSSVVWTYDLKDSIISDPIIGDNNHILYLASTQGFLYALDIASGHLLWNSRIPGEIYANLALSPRCPDYRCIQSLYGVNIQGELFAYNTTFDRPKFVIPYNLISSENNITNYLLVELGGVSDSSVSLQLLDIQNNIFLWNKTFSKSPQEVNYLNSKIENNIYLFVGNQLYILDKYTGNTISQHQIACQISDYFLLDGNINYICSNWDGVYGYYVNQFNQLNILSNETRTIINQNSSMQYNNLRLSPDNKSFILLQDNNLVVFNTNNTIKLNTSIGINTDTSIIYELTNTSLIYNTRNNIYSTNIYQGQTSLISQISNYMFVESRGNKLVIYENQISQVIIKNVENNQTLASFPFTGINDIVLEKDRLNIFSDQMSILNYSGYLINNITLPPPIPGQTYAIYANYIWNKDATILYNWNGQYLHAISNTSQVLWKYPMINFIDFYLSEDEKYILVERMGINSELELVSLRLP